MSFVIWAKPLRLWQILLVLLPLLALFGGQYALDASRRASLRWPVPSRAELRQVTGRLAPPYWASRGKTTLDWGRLLLDDGSVFSFTCRPGDAGPVIGDASCAYSTPWNRDPNIGKRLTLYYFDVPRQQTPPHVVMEITGAGIFSSTVLLRYADSVDRLNDYKQDAANPGFLTLGLGVFLLLMLPGLIWRLVAGRDPDRPEAPKARVELSGV
jgi:hypothetical protein